MIKRLLPLLLLAVIFGPTATSRASADNEKVILYLFHGDVRCTTCLAFEKFSKTALAKFPEDVRQGRIEWREVNFDRPENKHFIKDFALFDKGVVLTRERDGKVERWKNIEEVWDFYDDETGFVTMLSKQIMDFLGN